MRTRDLQVSIDGDPITSYSNRIKVVDVIENKTSYSIETERIGVNDGMHITGTHRDSVSVTIEFIILVRDAVERSRILDSVISWCKNGLLRVSTRPGKMLQVITESYPCLNGMNMSNVLSATFVAYRVPYWIDETPSRAVMNGSGEFSMYVTGTANNTTCTFEAKNAGNTNVNKFEISIADTLFEFENLGLGPGETLVSTYTERGYLRLYIKHADGTETSAHSKRTTKSDDELLAKCGKSNNVKVITSMFVQTVVSAHGRWL